MPDIKKIQKVEKINTTEKISQKRARANRQFDLSTQEYDFEKVKGEKKIEDTRSYTPSSRRQDNISISDLSKDLSTILDFLEGELLDSLENTEDIKNFISFTEEMDSEKEALLENIVRLELELIDNINDIKNIEELDKLIYEDSGDGENLVGEKVIEKDLQLEANLKELKSVLIKDLNADVARVNDLLRDIAKQDPALFRNLEEYKNLTDDPNLKVRIKLIENLKEEVLEIEKNIRLIENVDFTSLDGDMDRLEFNNILKKNLDMLKYLLNSNRQRILAKARPLDRLLQRSINEEVKIKNNEIYKNFNKENIEDKNNPYYSVFLGKETIEKLKKEEMIRIRDRKRDITSIRKDVHPGYLNIFNNLDNRPRDIFFVVLGFFMAVIILKIIF